MRDDTFRYVKMARQAKTMHGLRLALRGAEHRVIDAERAGWPALAKSWQRDVDEIKALIAGKVS